MVLEHVRKKNWEDLCSDVAEKHGLNSDSDDNK